MATITPTKARIDAFPYPVQSVSWASIVGAADSCTAFQCAQLRDKSVQLTGSAGSATIAIHGSNDGTNYAVLADPAGNSLMGLTTGIYQIGQITLWIKPVGTGTLGAITATLIGACGTT